MFPSLYINIDFVLQNVKKDIFGFQLQRSVNHALQTCTARNVLLFAVVKKMKGNYQSYDYFRCNVYDVVRVKETQSILDDMNVQVIPIFFFVSKTIKHLPNLNKNIG